MNKHFTKSLILFSLFAASLTACKKDKDEEVKPKTKTELLTEKTWKYVDYGTDGNLNWTIESSESDLEVCEKDNIFTFKSDNTITETENANKCSTESEYKYTWKFIDDEKKIVVTATDSDTLNIKTLDSTTFEIYWEDSGDRHITKFSH